MIPAAVSMPVSDSLKGPYRYERCDTRKLPPFVRDAGPVCSDRVANLLRDGGHFGPKYAERDAHVLRFRQLPIASLQAG